MWHDIQVSHCLMLTYFCDSENYILCHDLFPLDSTMLNTPTHTSVVKPMYWAASPPPLLHVEAGNCSVHQTSVCDIAKPQNEQNRQSVCIITWGTFA